MSSLDIFKQKAQTSANNRVFLFFLMVEQKANLPFLKRKQKKVKHSILVENEFQVFNKRNSFEGVQRNVGR